MEVSVLLDLSEGWKQFPSRLFRIREGRHRAPGLCPTSDSAAHQVWARVPAAAAHLPPGSPWLPSGTLALPVLWASGLRLHLPTRHRRLDGSRAPCSWSSAPPQAALPQASQIRSEHASGHVLASPAVCPAPLQSAPGVVRPSPLPLPWFQAPTPTCLPSAIPPPSNQPSRDREWTRLSLAQGIPAGLRPASVATSSCRGRRICQCLPPHRNRNPQLPPLGPQCVSDLAPQHRPSPRRGRLPWPACFQAPL